MIDLGVMLDEPDALIDHYLPRMLDLLDRPHIQDTSWYDMRTELAAGFESYGWDAEAAFVAFDLICAFAARMHESSSSAQP